MISTRRIVAAVGLAAGVTGLAAPLASAAPAGAADTGRLSPLSVLDSVGTTGLPAERRGQLPTASEQLGSLNQLQPVTGLAAPVTGLSPAVQ